MKLDHVKAINDRDLFARRSAAAAASDAPFVAVFVGATSGIGLYTLQALIRRAATSATGVVPGGLRVYIVARKEARARQIIDECKAAYPAGDYVYVQASDLSLIKNVDAASKRIQEEETSKSGQDLAHIDLLVMTQGGLYLKGRQETAEGIPFDMAMHYYSRARFCLQLLPLLKASTNPSHVISVYAAGMENTLIQDDLILEKRGNYSFNNARSHCVYFTTMLFERLARENAGQISFVNLFPGLVLGEGANNPDFPLWFKITWKVLGPIAGLLISTPPDECAERVLYLASSHFPPAPSSSPPFASSSSAVEATDVAMSTTGESGGGAYACKQDSETIDRKKHDKVYGDKDKRALEQAVWEHTMQTFEKASL